MKTFFIILVLGVVGLSIWYLGFRTENQVATIDYTNTPGDTSVAYITPTLSATSTATPVSTPRATARPTPGPAQGGQGLPGQGGQGPAPARQPVFVKINANNNSQTGVAAITANGNDLAVINFNMPNAPIGTTQQAYIFAGTCADYNAVIYTLEPLFNGSSTTTTNLDFLDAVHGQGHASIVVYQPRGQLQYIYACGQIY